MSLKESLSALVLGTAVFTVSCTNNLPSAYDTQREVISAPDVKLKPYGQHDKTRTDIWLLAGTLRKNEGIKIANENIDACVGKIRQQCQATTSALNPKQPEDVQWFGVDDKGAKACDEKLKACLEKVK